MINAELVDVPIIEWTMVLKLQRANRMCDLFDGVRLTMSPIVHGVDAPLAVGPMMLGMQDAVHDRVAHVEIGGIHVDLGSERASAVRKLTGPHTAKKIQTFFNTAIAIRTFLAALDIAAMACDFLGR